MTDQITVDPIVVFAAFRYALGRSTYIVSDVADCIIRNAQVLPRQDRLQMIREIEEAISTGRAGASMDASEWNNVRERLRKETA